MTLSTRKLVIGEALILLTLMIGCASSQTTPGALRVDGAAPLEVNAGETRFRWSHREGRHAVLSVVMGGRAAWSSVPGQAFVGASRGRAVAHESHGLITLEDEPLTRCGEQVVTAATALESGIQISGELRCEGTLHPYRLRLEALEPGAIRLALDFPGATELNRAVIRFTSIADEQFFGFGEQFTHAAFKGARVPVLVSEQGIGRGEFPVTLGADLAAGSGGDRSSTYAPVPWFLTSERRGFALENTEYSIFDLRNDTWVDVEVFANTLSARMWVGESPLAVLERYTAWAGRMRPLPAWVDQGAIIAVQGGTDRVRALHQTLRAAGVPISAYWMQDWVGQRETSFGKRLWWNWELDAERYPGWDALVDELAAENIRVLGYVNPFLVDVAAKPNARRLLFEEAREQGFLVKNAEGLPYLIPNGDFSAALVDLSHPGAADWLAEVMREELLERGFSGWMADFGEALPFDSHLANGTPDTWHNLYPEAWAELNRRVVDAAANPQDLLFFTRSGFTRSPAHSTLFWAGDQLVSWDEFDGIKSAVTGMITGGLSGFSLNHSDIGGYTTLNSPVQNYHRSEELLARWTELAAFTPLMRTHEGNRPGENAQIDGSPESLAHFARMVRVWRAWAPYRRELLGEALATGAPLMRHPWLEHPEAPDAHRIRHETFLIGRDLLVAPALDAGQTLVRAYLPAGGWVHVWSGRVEDFDQARWVSVEAPIGRPAVFVRKGSAAGETFVNALRADGLLE